MVTLFEDNFDSETPGNPPANWVQPDPNTTAVILSGVYTSPNNSMAMVGFFGFGGVFHYFSPAVQPTHIHFEGYVEDNIAFAFKMGNSGGNFFELLIFDFIPLIIVNGNDTGQILITWIFNSFDIKNINYTAQTFDFYINDVLILTGVPFLNPTTNVDVIWFEVNGFGGIGFAVDDVLVEQDIAPTIEGVSNTQIIDSNSEDV